MLGFVVDIEIENVDDVHVIVEILTVLEIL